MRNIAKNKIELLSERVAFWKAPDNNATSNLLSSIQTALTNFSVIKLDYYSPGNDQTTNRQVEPFAVINKVGESWYLIAWCRMRKDYRLFKFDRIIKIEITEDRFTPHKITLTEYLDAYRKKNFNTPDIL